MVARNNRDIGKLIETWSFCNVHSPANKNDKLKPISLAGGPWKKIGMDILKHEEKYYVVIIEYFYRFIEIIYINGLTNRNIINKMKNVFSKYDIPNTLVTDNCGQYKSDSFKQFA